MANANIYFDIEGQLVDATVSALLSLGIPTTEMFAGDIKPGQRVEVKADLIGETGQEDIAANGWPLRIGYQLTLMLELATPIENPVEHRSLRGRIRSHLVMCGGVEFLKPYLPYAEIIDIQVGSSINETMAGDEDFDELITTQTYQVTLALKPGHSPIG